MFINIWKGQLGPSNIRVESWHNKRPEEKTCCWEKKARLSLESSKGQEPGAPASRNQTGLKTGTRFPLALRLEVELLILPLPELGPLLGLPKQFIKLPTGEIPTLPTSLQLPPSNHTFPQQCHCRSPSRSSPWTAFLISTCPPIPSYYTPEAPTRSSSRILKTRRVPSFYPKHIRRAPRRKTRALEAETTDSYSTYHPFALPLITC